MDTGQGTWIWTADKVTLSLNIDEIVPMKRLIAFKIIFLKDHPATCLLIAIIRQCQMNDHDRMISFWESRPVLVDDCIHCFQR